MSPEKQSHTSREAVRPPESALMRAMMAVGVVMVKTVVFEL